MDDFFPSLDAFTGGDAQAFFGAFCDDRHNTRDTELGGLFDEPLEAIKLKESGQKGDMSGWTYGRDGFKNVEDGAVWPDRGDLGEPRLAMVRELVTLADFGPKHAHKMPGVVAGELGAITLHTFYEEAAACQKTC